jgi:hypothetical protein
MLKGVKPVDIEYLRRLSPLTNVIPLIARSDTLSAEELQLSKVSISSELKTGSIHPFTFGVPMDPAVTSSGFSPPYAISTAKTNDNENMDASLLMSPDYVQPLVPTELAALVEQIFERDTVSWLRHSAAKKCIQWRNNSPNSSTSTQSIPSPLGLLSSSSSALTSRILTPSIGATNTFALARITDHTQREERLAQVRLSKWATDLQRSLQNERARFEALAKGERAVWLTERLNECVQDGTLVPITPSNLHNNPSSSFRHNELSMTGPLVKQGNAHSHRASKSAQLNQHDPLGLVQLNAEMKRRSWAALQIVGSFGILGGLAIWLARNWGRDEETMAWGFDWTRVMMDW